MDYINNITEAIGRTPLMKLNKIGRDAGANVFVKLEYLNPSGSYKDRMALAMVEAAERGETWNGRKLSPGGTVVEASAGNTAPAVAMVCAAKGYKAKIFLYRYQMEDKRNARMLITQAYGPEVGISSEPNVYLTQEQIDELSRQDPDLLHVLAAKMDCQLEEDKTENCVWVDQIYNKYNYLGQLSLGAEVYQQLEGKVDAVLLTGGVVHNEYIVEQLKKRVGFIAPVYVYPGEREMLSLGQQTYYALTGKEEVFEL